MNTLPMFFRRGLRACLALPWPSGVARWWLGALLTVVLGFVVWLTWFLQEAEQQEERLRQRADLQWLEQTLRFHFQRLERDVSRLPPHAVLVSPHLSNAGQLWRGTGVVRWQSWVEAAAFQDLVRWSQQASGLPVRPEDRERLGVMLDTSRGLARAAYAGPLTDPLLPQQRLLWLAVPRWGPQGFMGSQVVALDVAQTVAELVPDWFLQQHRLHEATDLAGSERIRAPLPGTQWEWGIEWLDTHAPTAPRLFFGVALACLGAMLWTLALLWRDAAQRRATEQRLERSGRLIAMGEVASTLAHELNQPLGALSGFSSGLLHRAKEQRITLEESLPILERIAQLSDKAGHIIQRVNAFARRQDMQRQPLALVAWLRRWAPNTGLPEGVSSEWVAPAAEIWIEADALLLEHAVHNVWTNAAEWALRGPRRPAVVRMACKTEGNWVGVVIEDSGPGVHESLRPKVFDAFTSHKPGGMGMGLSICRSIIEAHHGRIEVDESLTLHGARFTLWLPLPP